MNVSFRGSAWLMIYHLGVLAHLRERTDTTAMRFAGASSGAVTAAAAVSGIDVEVAREWLVRRAEEARQRRLGPVGRMSHYVRSGLEHFLPDDAHQRASGRLLISVTQLPRLDTMYVRDFTSRHDLISGVLASCYIPIYYERPVVYRGRVCIDGGLSDNCPRIDGQTITVSPRRGAYHICPDITFPRRLGLLPPDAETLGRIYRLGYANCRDWPHW